MKDAIARVCGEPEDPPAGKPAKRWAFFPLDCDIEVITSSGAPAFLVGICFPFCTTRQLKQVRSWACRELNLSATIFKVLLVYELLQPGLDNVPLKVLTVETKDF